MLTALAPLIAVGGFALYFLATFRFAIYRRRPWEFLAISGAGAALGVYRLAVLPSWATGLAASLAVGVFAFACWFLLSFSMYATREDRPRTGERFPAFTLPTSDGGTFHLGAHPGRRHLVVLYRGAW